jgi:hypothetical protein
MSVELNRTIVRDRDNRESVPPGEPPSSSG